MYTYLYLYLEIQDSKKRNTVHDSFKSTILRTKLFSKGQNHDKNLGQNTHRSVWEVKINLWQKKIVFLEVAIEGAFFLMEATWGDTMAGRGNTEC